MNFTGPKGLQNVPAKFAANMTKRMAGGLTTFSGPTKLPQANNDHFAASAPSAAKLPRCRAGRAKPPKAISKPYTRHILGIDSGVQSHLKATPKPHQGYLKATQERR